MYYSGNFRVHGLADEITKIPNNYVSSQAENFTQNGRDRLKPYNILSEMEQRI